MPTLRNDYAQVSMIDDNVGRVMDTLDRLGLAEDTILVFTSDHGLSLGHHGFWRHGTATYPADTHRAAHSVPLILRHPGSMAPGQRSAAMVSNMDLFATLLNCAGQPSDQHRMRLPSRTLKPLATGTGEARGEDAVISEQEETSVVRTPKWACFKRFKDGPGAAFEDELFKLGDDPGETRNLAVDPACADIRAALEIMLTDVFTQHARPVADLWQGGVPIQHSERKVLWHAACL